MFPEAKCQTGQAAEYIKYAASSDVQGIKGSSDYTEIKNAARRLIY